MQLWYLQATPGRLGVQLHALCMEAQAEAALPYTAGLMQRIQLGDNNIYEESRSAVFHAHFLSALSTCACLGSQLPGQPAQCAAVLLEGRQAVCLLW